MRGILLLFLLSLLLGCTEVPVTPSTNTRTAEAAMLTLAPTQTPTSTLTPTVTPTPTSTPEPVALRWRVLAPNRVEQAIFQEIANDVEAANPQFDILFEAQGDRYFGELWKDLEAGSAPDVFWLPAAALADYVHSGHIANLHPFAAQTEDYNESLFYPGTMFHLTFDPQQSGEVLWGVPRDVSTFAIYINTDLIEAADAPDPRTMAAQNAWNWEAFRSLAQQLTSPDEDQFGFGQSDWWGTHGTWVFGAGGRYLNSERTVCALDSTQALAGLDFERSLFADLRVAAPLGSSPEKAFLSGNMGMYLDGRWFTPRMREQAEFNWDVVELPVGDAGAFNWLFWGAYVVNAQTPHLEEAWELVWALSSAETQQQLTASGINIPSRVGGENVQAFLDSIPPTNNIAFLAGLSNAETEAPLWGGNFSISDSVAQTYVGLLMRGAITLEEFSAEICPAVNSVLP